MVDLDLEISLKLRARTSTTVDPTWSTTTSTSNIKTILPPAEPLGQTKFCLQPLFCVIELTFVSNNISGS